MNIGKTGQIIKNIAIDSAAKVEPKVVSKIAEDVVCFGKEAAEKTLTKLSKNVDFRPSGKEFRYVSLPKGLDIVDGAILGNTEVPTIAIIDLFSDFGNYGLGKKIKIPHGKIVSKIMTKGLEDKVGVLALDSTPKSKTEWVAMKEALDELVKLKKSGKDIKALNLSVGASVTFDEITEKAGTIVTADVIKNQFDKILNSLRNSKDQKDTNIFEMIKSINELVDEGVQVYLSSGNNGSSGFDLLALSRAQHIVGAEDYANATKAFVNETAKGVYKFKILFDRDGSLKSAISDEIKFDSSDVSKVSKLGSFMSKFFGETEATICGTSFSCPAKLNSDMKKKL